MVLKLRPLLMAAGAGLAVQIVVTLISMGASLFMIWGSYNGPVNPSFAGISMVAAGVALFCPPVVDLVVGGLYAFFYSKIEFVTPGAGAVGGAIASTAVRFVNGLANICLNGLVTPLIFMQMRDGELQPEFLGIMMGSSLVTGIVGLVFALIIGCVLGAIGGLIGAVLFKERFQPV